MAHTHKVLDSDGHYVIDPVTKNIMDETEGTTVVQYDHNCERLTFKIPRYIEDHDMLKCSIAQVHFSNNTNSGIYDITDLAEYPNDDNFLIGTWLISQDVTQLAGTIKFKLKFVCFNEKTATIDYILNTSTFDAIPVEPGFEGSHISIDKKPDIVIQLEQRLFKIENITSGAIESVIRNDIYKIIYAGRDSEFSKPSVLCKYTGDRSKFTSLKDMPANSWFYAPGSEVQTLSGKNLKWQLAETTTYIVTRRDIYSGSAVYTIQRIKGVDEYWGYTLSTNSDIEWNVISTREILLEKSSLPERQDHVLYTEFENIKGWWGANGTFADTNRYHSQLIPIVGGKSYYVGFKLTSNTNDVTITGAFFDANGDWIAPLRTADVVPYEYQNARGVYPQTSNYADIHTFVAPDNACYLSINLSFATTNVYRQYVSSFPIFALNNTGNYGFRDDYPMYQAHKNKKLCIIGASGVALDREEWDVALDRDEPNNKEKNRFIVGFQEYLIPWYAEVTSYGCPGGGYRKNDSSKFPSIYKGIIEGGVDLSPYDEFIFVPSTNDLNTGNMGEIDSIDVSTYFGGLNAIISEIQRINPNAKIYIVNAVRKGSYYTDASGSAKIKIDTLNEKLEVFAKVNSFQLINLADNCGINKFNEVLGNLTIDGTHLNHEGNKIMGLYLRKDIIGF